MTEALAQTHSPASATEKKLFSGFAGGLSLATINRILAILAILVFAYFIVTLLAGTVKLLGVGQQIRSLEAKGAAAARPAQEKAPAAFIAADPGLSNRNIFQPSGAASSMPSAQAASSAQSAYKLVGISESKDPSQTYVMVENSQTKLTYFLQYGQSVEGLELERILEDKVIVKIGGKAVELE